MPKYTSLRSLLLHMRAVLLVMICMCCSPSLKAQPKTPAQFGFRSIRYLYKADTVQILVRSRKGEELKPKPILLFVQGSLPVPLIIYDAQDKPYGVFPFKSDSLEENYHLIIIGKPGIPLMARDSDLASNYTYVDPKTKAFTSIYLKNNNIKYYADRDNAVLNYLLRQKWVSTTGVVVAGHSEGAIVAAKMALTNKHISRLIYSGGNPLGRMMSIIQAVRSNGDSSRVVKNNFERWKSVVSDPEDTASEIGDPAKTTYQASSIMLVYDLLKIKVPVLVSYGTLDHAVYGCDFLRLEAIRLHNTNFTFKAYTGLEHNYFQLLENGHPNYELYNWDKVALDWRDWLNNKTELRNIEE